MMNSVIIGMVSPSNVPTFLNTDPVLSSNQAVEYLRKTIDVARKNTQLQLICMNIAGEKLFPEDQFPNSFEQAYSVDYRL